MNQLLYVFSEFAIKSIGHVKLALGSIDAHFRQLIKNLFKVMVSFLMSHKCEFISHNSDLITHDCILVRIVRYKLALLRKTVLSLSSNLFSCNFEFKSRNSDFFSQ